MAVVNDILSNVAVNENVIPEGFLTFAEASAYVAENIDYDFNDMLESSGLVDENGTIIESTVITEGFADSAIAFFQRVWAAIKAFFAKVGKWFADRAAQAKAAFTKLGNSLADKVENARYKKALRFTEKISGEVVDAAKMSKDQSEVKYHKWNFTFEISKTIKDCFTNASKLTKKEAKGWTQEDIDRIPADLLGTSGVISIQKMKEDFSKELGRENIVTNKIPEIDDDFIDAAIETVIRNGNQRAVKAEYNEARKGVKDCIAKVKEWDKNAKGSEYAGGVKALKTILQCIQAFCAVEMDCRRTMVAESYRILNRIYNVGARELAKQKIKESVDTGSIFAW